MIRLVLLFSLFFIAGYVTFGKSSAGIRASRKFLFVTVLLLGSFAVLRPDSTTKIANLMGVGRGTDLLLYILTIVVLASLMRGYLEEKKKQKKEALLVQNIAILQAELESLKEAQKVTS